MEKTRPVLSSLTGMRFLAALLVVAHHFATPTNAVLKTMNDHGFIGVTLFFILSGFILTYTYLLDAGLMKGNAKSFWKARFSRIFPVYLISLVLATPVVLAWTSSSTPYLAGLSSLIFLQAWLPFAMHEWNPPGWSLSAEAFFYLVFPLALKQISRLQMRALLIFASICWAASLAAPIIYFATGSIDRAFWMFNPAIRLPEFLLGVVAGILWTQHHSIIKRVPKYLADASLIALVTALSIPLHEAYFMNGTFAPLMIMIIIGLATNHGAAANILRSRLLIALGGASYSMYILHWPLWYETNFIVQRLQPNIGANSVFWLVTLGVLIPAAYFCFKFVEEPMNRILRTRFKKHLESQPVHQKNHPLWEDPLNRNDSPEIYN